MLYLWDNREEAQRVVDIVRDAVDGLEALLLGLGRLESRIGGDGGEMVHACHVPRRKRLSLSLAR